MPADPFVAISQFADTNGDGTGTKNAIGDFSSTQGRFYFKCAPSEIAHISRVLVSLSDSVVSDSALYGGLAALTNGVVIEVRDADDNVIYNITDVDEPVKTNGHWARYSFDTAVKVGDFPLGDDVLVVRWSFWKFMPQGITLMPGWSLNILLDDDFTGLVSHTFALQGHFSRPENKAPQS